MNLSEIVANVKATVNPATNIDTLFKRWANRAQKTFIRAADHKFSWLRLSNLTFATAANSGEYAMSPLLDLAKTIKFTVRGGNVRVIRVLPRQEFLERIQDPTLSTGLPTIACLTGFWPVQYQPTSASLLSLVSTSAGDTSTVKIEGLSASGVLQSEEKALNGTNVVATSLTYSKILGVGFNGFTAGSITMTSNGGAVTNAVYSPRNRQGMFPVFTFYPTPSGVETIYYDGYMALPPLVADNDFSLMPEAYHEAIELFCEWRGFKLKKDYQSAASAKAEFYEIVAQAVEDDSGPEMQTVMRDYHPSGLLDDDDLPGNYPRE